MAQLVIRNDRITEWVAERIPAAAGIGFGPSHSIGVVIEGRVASGVVFHDWQPRQGTIQLSIAAENPRWASRANIRAILSYPFDQIGAIKVWAVIPHTNERVVRFAKALGFKQEGMLRHQFGVGIHAVFVGLMANEYYKQYRKDN